MLKYPDYDNSIVNLVCSIADHFGVVPHHQTLPDIDLYLKKKYQNIVLMLFDGLGLDALEYHLPPDSFLRKNFKRKISSVFPPTTTAAISSIESGLTPAEHGWLGWDLYFQEIDQIVDIFPNTLADREDVLAAEYHVANKYLPFKNIREIINQAGKGKAYNVSPFGDQKISTYHELFQTVAKLCGQKGKKYIYTYWSQPDHVMHDTGCYSQQTEGVVKEINDLVEKTCDKLKDTLIIVTADHGHINVKYKFVSDYPNVANLLIRPISIESRAAAFYIKEGGQEKFPQEFYKAFGNDFLLLPKEEVLTKKIFGPGKPHPKFNEFIGDFLAIALSDKAIVNNHDSDQFLSTHAGLTEQEMIVPLIIIEKPAD